MKFKNKAGTVFEDIQEALEDFCKLPENASNTECRNCVFTNPELTCTEFCDTYPIMAARLMGYEVIEDDRSSIGQVNEAEPVNCGSSKPLSEWTLAEMKAYCAGFCDPACEGKSCMGCAFLKHCPFIKLPHEWDLEGAAAGIKIVQIAEEPLKLEALKASLRHDEEIACLNAAVIADKEGGVTGWVDMRKPLQMIITGVSENGQGSLQ